MGDHANSQRHFPSLSLVALLLAFGVPGDVHGARASSRARNEIANQRPRDVIEHWTPEQFDGEPMPNVVVDRSIPIDIVGDYECVMDNQAALQLLKERAPEHFKVVTDNIRTIECLNSGSGMDAPTYTFQEGLGVRSHGRKWLAGSIAHDAHHSRLYHDFESSHPGELVPADVWTGEEAERKCIDVQLGALSLMNAPQEVIAHVSTVIDSRYWEAVNRNW